MNRNSVLALASLVVFLLPFNVNAELYPTGAYKYKHTPAPKASGSTSRSSVPGNVSTPRSIQGDTRDFEEMRDLPINSLEYKLGRKVAIVYLGQGTDITAFTGFLVGPDLLLTSNHCLFKEDNTLYSLQGSALRMDFYSRNQGSNPLSGAKIKKILKNSWNLDYALLQLDRSLGDTYGWLDISTSTPPLYSSVTIIQHPRGRPKEIVRKNSSITKVYPTAIHYEADTEGGSSGSPVFIKNSRHVIALHHSGRAGHHNEGILMKRIYPEIKSFIQDSQAAPKKRTHDLANTKKFEQSIINAAEKFEQGQYSAAIKDFDQAIRLKPDFFLAYHLRGVAKKRLGQYNAAIKDFDQVIRLKPDDANTYHWRGVAKHKLERNSEALQDFQTSLKLAEKAGNTQLKTNNKSWIESIVTASLDINSVPNRATVYIDGRKIGITSIHTYKVDTGTRGEKQVKIELVLDGHKRHTANITLVGGKTKTFNVELEKLPTPRKPERRPAPEPERRPTPTPTLDITSTPSGATVYIDGTNVGTTPLRGHKVDTRTRSEKQVKVSLELEGYKSRETHITLENAESKPLNVELEKIPTQITSQAIAVEKRSEKMVLIPAGKFRMGTDTLVGNESKPIHTVDLDAFYIDTHEVTVGEYKEFLLESGHPVSLHRNLSEFSPTDDHPIVGVSWLDAMAYAQWAGKRLPTEAEWEKAARGRLIDEHYPWGNDEIDSSKANYGNIHGRTMPVGSYPPNAFGLYDMAGNVAEWCMDPWDSNFYANSPAKNPFAGHKSLDETIVDSKSVRGLRVIRGGSWSQTTSPTFWVSARLNYDVMKKAVNIGFRCVKDAP